MPDELQNEAIDATADEEAAEAVPAASDDPACSDAAPEAASVSEKGPAPVDAVVDEGVADPAEDGPAAVETQPDAGEQAPAEATAAADDEGAVGGAESSKEAPEAAEEEEFEDLEPPIIAPPPDDGVKRRWYAIHAHSGQEANVQAALRVKAEQSGLTDVITNVFVPMEEVAEFKSGEKRLTKRKFFPGYVLVQLPEHPEEQADLWHLIKDTPGVTGFIGSRTEPVPLEDAEVMALVEEMRGERERPRTKVAFDIGERVKIIDGAFSNFMGNIGEVNEDRGRVKVLIEIFERQTSVEVEFWQIEKI